MGTVDTSKVTVRQISKFVAENMIKKYHYTHTFPASCQYSLGVFYKSSEHQFFEDDQELIGCLTYGPPVGRRAAASISPELKISEVLELTRLFVHDKKDDKNIESYVISQSFRWLKENAPNIKVLVSYADPAASHLGKIYQATNWIYQGIGQTALMDNHSIKLEENGKWIHSRTIGDRFGSRNIEHLKRVIGKSFWRRLDSPKHRYIYFLCDKREKRKILKSLKMTILPYPKDATAFIPTIELIKVKQKEGAYV
jgi:hypothetical protein